ncbi:phosphoglycerate dehydrogenase [Gammaproteobacteria bacterium]|nr:phosphoglycerate dehydrogenase [Gammaproteobacteria bacterium]MDA9834642.1 phosphoglycerate dehydrogenase [Gammaproteobacteria bacterium]MDC3371942.1 phosphoglycerate dehydrogenase [Gammaproteobacteria bacterium]
MNLLDTVAVASRSFSKNQDLVNALEDKYSKVIFNETGATLQDQDLINFLSTADKAIIGIEKISAEVLQKLPKLKVVSKYGVGINNLDIEAFKSKGIKLGFTPGVNKQSVAELALTLTLISLRKIHRNHAEIADGIWSQEKGSELFGKTIGLLGFGNIGQKFASFLAPFNCKIIFFDEKIFSNQELLSIATTLGLKRGQMQQEDLTEVLHHSDILSIHLPLLPETENTINSKELSLLKPSISIINTARGGIVNESALHAFLSSNPDSFAAFDVYAEEPALKNPLFKLPNFFGTSHRSSLTHEGINAMGLAAIAGLDDNKILT